MGAVHSPVRLLQLTVLAAAVTTAMLSLNATVVLMTPVVLATARLLRVRDRPPVAACAHLANSASLLLPRDQPVGVRHVGFSFAGFAAVIAGPWLLVVAGEYLVLRLWYRAAFAPRRDEEPAATGPDAVGPPDSIGPDCAGGVGGSDSVGLGLAGGCRWIGLGRVGTRRGRSRARSVRAVVRAADPGFCRLVLVRGVVVPAVASHGLGAALAAALPTGADLGGLLLAAVLANLLNNLPATLLWRRVLEGTGAAPGAREFTALAVLAMWTTLPPRPLTPPPSAGSAPMTSDPDDGAGRGEGGGDVDAMVDARRASVVAFYGGTSGPLADLVGWVQDTAARRLGPAFLPRPPDTVHATVIGLETPPPGWADADRSRFDARPLVAHLVRAFSEHPLELQFGGAAADDLRWTSRGVSRYRRCFLAGPVDVVLIGWPVRFVGGQAVPLPALAEIRRGCEAYGARHRYHATPADADPDAYLVLGRLNEAPGPATARLAEEIRDTLAVAPRRVHLGPEQLSLVEYADTTLPRDSTRRRALVGF